MIAKSPQRWCSLALLMTCAASLVAANDSPLCQGPTPKPQPSAVMDQAPAVSEVNVEVSAGEKDGHGFLIHQVTSPFQSGQTKIRVLLPSTLTAGERYRVLYVLPVEAQDENRYGDGLLECLQAEVHDRYHVICVAPTFSDLPWYADHPTDTRLRQETYFLCVVVPFVEKTYPALLEPRGRTLVGFSKSGWGAVSLLVRHLELFGRAAAWDAPLMLEQPNQYGMGPIFGTQENFENYQITRLLETHASAAAARGPHHPFRLRQLPRPPSAGPFAAGKTRHSPHVSGWTSAKTRLA